MSEANGNSLDSLVGLSGFRCIVADPPWQPTLHANNPRRKTLDFAGPQRFYPTMSVDGIAALPVAD